MPLRKRSRISTRRAARSKRRPAKRGPYCSSNRRYWCAFRPTRPSKPISPMARSMAMSSGSTQRRSVAVQSETLGSVLPAPARRDGQGDRAHFRDGHRGSTRPYRPAPARCMTPPMCKSASRAEEISRMYADRSHGIEEMTVATVQRIVERASAIEDRTRLLDQTAEHASAQARRARPAIRSNEPRRRRGGRGRGVRPCARSARAFRSRCSDLSGGVEQTVGRMQIAQHAQRAFRRDRRCDLAPSRSGCRSWPRAAHAQDHGPSPRRAMR